MSTPRKSRWTPDGPVTPPGAAARKPTPEQRTAKDTEAIRVILSVFAAVIGLFLFLNGMGAFR